MSFACRFLRTNKCSLCAFVIPTYEVSKSAKFPKNKDKLKELLEVGDARPFHKKVFSTGQFATNFSM